MIEIKKTLEGMTMKIRLELFPRCATKHFRE